MLEELFLTYANFSLRDDPENLRIVFKEILRDAKDESSIGDTFTELLIEYIIDFAKLDDPNKAEEILKQLRKKELDPLLLDIAYEAVYGYRDGYCERGCRADTGIDVISLLKTDGFVKNERLKCYECHQLVYIYHLSQLVRASGLQDMIEHLEMEGINRRVLGGNFEKLYVNSAYDNVKTQGSITDNGKIQKSDFVSLGNLVGEWSTIPEIKWRFEGFLNSVVGYSLTQFLIHNDRRKLKKCQMCKNYFIASKADKRIKYCQTCSPKSKLTKEEQKEAVRKHREKKRIET